MPGLEGDYLTLDGDVVAIHEPQGNEYPVVITADGETNQVTLRAVQFGSLFLAQLHDPTGAEPGALVFFLTPRGGSIYMHIPTTPVDELAERHGLRLTGGTELTGDTVGTRNFLEEVAALPMSSVEVLTTK